ncbi:hypothetical protein TIFTF001_037009 [Ficus carica]|uniref:Uncharacterized protein n=1 Tax=Ficus carica TaxID=3494 RepID=A0AA88EFH5_FICCA|nr:hypothetical protein TIFTF001_037009 [Ficus carica]
MIMWVQHTIETCKRDAVEFRSSCEVKRCCIFVFNVLIASDIILRIITSTFIVPGGTGLSGGGGNSGVDHRVGVMFLLELDPVTSCVCVRQSVAIGMFPGMERGWIGATGLTALQWFYLMFAIVRHNCSVNFQCMMAKGLTVGDKLQMLGIYCQNFNRDDGFENERKVPLQGGWSSSIYRGKIVGLNPWVVMGSSPLRMIRSTCKNVAHDATVDCGLGSYGD